LAAITKHHGNVFLAWFSDVLKVILSKIIGLWNFIGNFEIYYLIQDALMLPMKIGMVKS